MMNLSTFERMAAYPYFSPKIGMSSDAPSPHTSGSGFAAGDLLIAAAWGVAGRRFLLWEAASRSFTGQERTQGGIGPSLPPGVPPYLGLEGISESLGGPLSSSMPCNSANPFCATSHVLSATATRCWMDLNS